MKKAEKTPTPEEVLGGKKQKTTGKKRKHKKTEIEHHADGSHTVRHTPEDGGPEVSYAAQDLDAVHDGLEQHVGEPNEGEESAAGGPGPAAPAAPAAPAGPSPGGAS